MLITKDQYKQSLQSCIKPGLLVILLTILRSFANNLPGSHQRIGNLFLGAYIEIAIVLVVSFYVFKIYAQIKTLLNYSLTKFAIKKRPSEALATYDLVTPLGEKITVALYLLFTYYYLIPVLKELGSYFLSLDYSTLSTISDIAALAALIYVVASLWRASQPLIDQLAGCVSEKVAPASIHSDVTSIQTTSKKDIFCPSCNKTNQVNTKFCIHCGTPLPQQPSEKSGHIGTCPNCGAQNLSSAKFCNECGHSLKQQQEIQ